MLIDRSLRTEQNMTHKINFEVLHRTYKVLKKLHASKKSTQHLTDIEIGALLRQYREALNLDKEQFSLKFHVKVSDLNAIERGDKSVLDTELDALIEKTFEEDYRECG